MPQITPYISYLKKTLKQTFSSHAISTNAGKKKQVLSTFMGELNIGGKNEVLADIVFEKTGYIFHKIKASFEGKPIATTRTELKKQLIDLVREKEAYSSFVPLSKYIRDIKKNLLELKKRDILTIVQISKFFHQLNMQKNGDLTRLLDYLHYKHSSLASIDKLITHPRKLIPEEIVSIHLESMNKRHYLDKY